MLPVFFTKLADRLFNYRWGFLLLVAVGISGLVFGVTRSPERAVELSAFLVGPLIVLPWALLCICIWFHPTRGNLQSESRFVGRLPPMAQSAIRWYASIFIIIFVLTGLIAWPATLMAVS